MSEVVSMLDARMKRGMEVPKSYVEDAGPDRQEAWLNRERLSCIYNVTMKSYPSAVDLTVHTRCPSKYILLDTENGRCYQGQVPDPTSDRNTSWTVVTEGFRLIEARAAMSLVMHGPESAELYKDLLPSDLVDGGHVMIKMSFNGTIRVVVAKLIIDDKELDTGTLYDRGYVPGTVATILFESGHLSVLMINSDGGVTAGPGSVASYAPRIPGVHLLEPMEWYSREPE
jgi:hypothetical protein